jgi:Flp pilus assembly protein TadD
MHSPLMSAARRSLACKDYGSAEGSLSLPRRLTEKVRARIVSEVTAAIEQGQPEQGKRSVAMFVVGALVGLALGFPLAYALLPADSAVARASGEAKSALLLTESQQALGSANPERALALLLEAAGLNPKNEIVQNNLCATLNELHHFDAAMVACTAAISLNEGFELARNNLAWAKAARDRAQAAVTASAPP